MYYKYIQKVFIRWGFFGKESFSWDVLLLLLPPVRLCLVPGIESVLNGVITWNKWCDFILKQTTKYVSRLDRENPTLCLQVVLCFCFNSCEWGRFSLNTVLTVFLKRLIFFISLIGCFWWNYFKERSENITLWKEGINKNGKCVFVIFLDILSILYWD